MYLLFKSDSLEIVWLVDLGFFLFLSAHGLIENSGKVKKDVQDHTKEKTTVNVSEKRSNEFWVNLCLSINYSKINLPLTSESKPSTRQEKLQVAKDWELQCQNVSGGQCSTGMDPTAIVWEAVQNEVLCIFLVIHIQGRWAQTDVKNEYHR